MKIHCLIEMSNLKMNSKRLIKFCHDKLLRQNSVLMSWEFYAKKHLFVKLLRCEK